MGCVKFNNIVTSNYEGAHREASCPICGSKIYINAQFGIIKVEEGEC